MIEIASSAQNGGVRCIFPPPTSRSIVPGQTIALFAANMQFKSSLGILTRKKTHIHDIVSLLM
jgi:hypothetical protein